ncbi:MAG TPA: ShlB/FhaC/HecB family hemolysin secretion/activation protein, partial [Niastella sp.]
LNNTYRVDQRAYLRARLFDMLIGDWDRHEGNWSWGEVTVPGGIQFEPVPKDRDQAFFYHNGIIINKVIQGSGLNFMQHFDYKVREIENLNTSGHLDRAFTNALTLADWQHEAEFLQTALTDSVIVQSVAQLPPEIYAAKGQELIDKLKARRNQIPTFAKQYYLFIAKEVEIAGTRQREYFEVTNAGDDAMAVAVYRFNNRGIKADTPYYHRVFNEAETKEIRLFGIKGDDVYVVNSNTNPITIRIIGGPGRDSIIQAKHPVHIYDDKEGNVFQTSSARMHLSSDTSIHTWHYNWFRYDKDGFIPVLFYNNSDRIFAGLNYRYTKQKWRQEPYAWKQEVGVHYSISQNALSAFWQALYPNVIGKWNLALRADYDVIRWTNFYGTGNETKYETNDLNYYRLRSEEWYASAGLNRVLGRSNVTVTGYYQRVKNRNDPDRYVTKVFSDDHNVYLPNTYAGLQLTYSYIALKDSVTPERGFTFFANAIYANNFQQNEFYQRYNATLQAYLPLIEHVSLSIRVGGETIVNDDVLNSGQAYEHAIIGGPRTLRGYRRERFWGKTACYNSNELRYITSFKSWLMNGKIGVFGFFDQGRVWMPGEKSDKIHISWGPGIILVPFNRYNISATYGITEEIRLVQLRLNKTI